MYLVQNAIYHSILYPWMCNQLKIFLFFPAFLLIFRTHCDRISKKSKCNFHFRSLICYKFYHFRKDTSL